VPEAAGVLSRTARRSPERSRVARGIAQQRLGARQIPDQGSEDRLAREPPEPDSLAFAAARSAS